MKTTQAPAVTSGRNALESEMPSGSLPGWLNNLPFLLFCYLLYVPVRKISMLLTIKESIGDVNQEDSAGLWYNRRVISSDQDVRIVLVRPRNPLNIGAAARAMLNFGFEDLVLVSPHQPVWQEARAAPGAETVLREARVVPQLLAAIEDRTLVIGTSSLSRRRVSQPVVSLDQMSSHWKKHRNPDRVAFLFGSEKTGLSKEDLSYCHRIVRIPTTAHCPSMNLGQAVAVCCYELRRLVGIKNRSAKETTAPAAVGEVERLGNEIEKLLRETAEPASSLERIRKARLRQMLLRWPITSQDVTLALGVLRDLSWHLQRKP